MATLCLKIQNMKRSRKPTNQIMIKANIRSNFYTVEFAILRISPEWVELTNQRLAAIKNFEVGFCIHNHSFWHSPITFYKSPVGGNLPFKILPIWRLGIHYTRSWRGKYLASYWNRLRGSSVHHNKRWNRAFQSSREAHGRGVLDRRI